MKKQILLIDDDQAILEVMEYILQYSGFEVCGRLNADNILTDIEEYKPDLILMDYLLSGLNGGQLCDKIKTNVGTKHIPVIMISAYARELWPSEACRCDDFIAKPFDIYCLVDRINCCIKG